MPSRTEGPPRGRVDGSQKRYRRWSCVRRSCERSRGDGGGRRVRGEARWSDEGSGGVPKRAEALARTHHGGDGVGELLRAGGAHAGLVHEGGERALFVAGEGEDRVAGPRRHARVEAGDPARVLHRASSPARGGTEWEMKPRPTRPGGERDRRARARDDARVSTRAEGDARARETTRESGRPRYGPRRSGGTEFPTSRPDDHHRRGARGSFMHSSDEPAVSPRSKRCLPTAVGRAPSSRRALDANLARAERRVGRVHRPPRWFQGRTTEKGAPSRETRGDPRPRARIAPSLSPENAADARARTPAVSARRCGNQDTVDQRRRRTTPGILRRTLTCEPRRSSWRSSPRRTPLR